MYDRWFSDQWFFDRCQEGSRYGIQLAVLLSLGTGFVLLALYWDILKQKVRLIDKLAIGGIVTSLTALAIPVWIGIIIIVGVFSCSAGAQLWPAVSAGASLHNDLKQLMLDGKPLPQTLEGLGQGSDRMARSYRQMVANAKVAYVVTENPPRYTLIIRPSRYIVAVFDSEFEYRFFTLNPTITSGWSAKSLPVFPPAEPGPWSALPQ